MKLFGAAIDRVAAVYGSPTEIYTGHVTKGWQWQSAPVSDLSVSGEGGGTTG
jgi:hypothetical protein